MEKRNIIVAIHKVDDKCESISLVQNLDKKEYATLLLEEKENREDKLNKFNSILERLEKLEQENMGLKEEIKQLNVQIAYLKGEDTNE